MGNRAEWREVRIEDAGDRARKTVKTSAVTRTRHEGRPQLARDLPGGLAREGQRRAGRQAHAERLDAAAHVVDQLRARGRVQTGNGGRRDRHGSPCRGARSLFRITGDTAKR